MTIRWWTWSAWLVALVCFANAPRALGQAWVEVRARTHVELAADSHPDALRVRGRLLDERNEPVPSVTVLLEVQGTTATSSERQRATTDDEGGFSASFAPIPREQPTTIVASFDGEDMFEPTRLEALIDETRSPVSLRVVTPADGRIDHAAASVEIVIDASSPAGARGLTIELATLANSVVATGSTGPDGRAVLRVAPARIGPPSSSRLQIRTAGDASRSPARLEWTVVLAAPTSIAWTAAPERVDQAWRLRGQLTSEGRPIAGAAVGVFAAAPIDQAAADEAPHLVGAWTDVEGEFSVDLADSAFDGRDAMSVVARFDSSVAHQRPSTTSPLELRRPGDGRPLELILAAAFSVLAIALAWVTLRRATSPLRAAADRTRPAGVERARASKAPSMTVTGRVIDARDGDPIAEATITVGASASVRSESDGSFTIEGDRQTHELRAHAEGYFDLVDRIALPHRGELEGATIRLRSTRDEAALVPRPIADRVLPNAETFATTTDRELVHEIAEAAPATVALVDELEQGVYGPTPPTAADVEALAARADAIARDLDAAPGNRKRR